MRQQSHLSVPLECFVNKQSSSFSFQLSHTKSVLRQEPLGTLDKQRRSRDCPFVRTRFCLSKGFILGFKPHGRPLSLSVMDNAHCKSIFKRPVDHSLCVWLRSRPRDHDVNKNMELVYVCVVIFNPLISCL